MSTSKLLLTPGTLWSLLVERAHHALEVGALHPIDTEFELFEQDGLAFLIRVATNLRRKDAERVKQAGNEGTADDATPFLPPEKDLLVAYLSDTHMAVLNKFNVIPYHLLILTRRFEHQEYLLTLQDFEALAACLLEVDGLGFYNGGTIAGASQAHKHLQLIPLPMFEGSVPPVPLETLIRPGDLYGDIRQLSTLPFRHAFRAFPPPFPDDALAAAAVLRQAYLDLLEAAEVRILARPGEVSRTAPYNLLVTRRWMLVVPRCRERFGSVSINALGYAGSLFVKNAEERRLLREVGPLSALAEVGCNGRSSG